MREPTTFGTSPATLKRNFRTCFSGIWRSTPQKRGFYMLSIRLACRRLAGTTNKDTMKKYEKPWHAALAQCAVEHFYYVTETGKSWAGPIEHATFRVVTGPWEDCFQKRPLIPEEGDLPQPKPNQEWWEYGFPLKAGAIYQHIEPDGWKCEAKAGTTSWEYRPYKPGPPIAFLYYIVSFPRSAADCESWVRHVLGPKPDKADLAELREIAAAFYEIAPRSASARSSWNSRYGIIPKKDIIAEKDCKKAPLRSCRETSGGQEHRGTADFQEWHARRRIGCGPEGSPRTA